MKHEIEELPESVRNFFDSIGIIELTPICNDIIDYYIENECNSIDEAIADFFDVHNREEPLYINELEFIHKIGHAQQCNIFGCVIV